MSYRTKILHKILCHVYSQVYGTFVQSRYEDKGERDVYLLSKKFSHVTFGPREDRVQVSHLLNSDSDCTDIPETPTTFSYGL